jgi:hypothetical protein
MGRDTHELPLFPSEEQIADLVLGHERAKEWAQIVAVLEKRGFPKVHPVMGGRKLADVLDFFAADGANSQTGLPGQPRSFTVARYAPDGPERIHAAPPPNSNGRRPGDRTRRAGT